MLFNSINYILLFLPITCVVYYLLLKQKLIVASKIWLVFASIVFYGWYDPQYTSLLLLSMLGNFIIGTSFNAPVFQSIKNRKILLIFGLVANILLLGYFKYANFFIDNVNIIFHSHIEIAKIVLPLGISFFTFTQIAYLVDAYKNEAKEYDFLSYMLFVTFFPHLIAGPILHHKEMMPQFNEVKRKVLKYKNFLVSGIGLFLIGLFKKVCIADTLSLYVANGYAGETNLSMLEAWIVMLSYTFQIYFDFSAYTDMAIGSAKILNIDLPQNFNSPYKAISVQDFWKRWHMTLSRFLRDYIYIPLGGNRNGEIRTYTNLVLTMLIGGLWHGASWLFVIWGGLHGFAQCINKLWQKTKIEMPRSLAILITFLFVNLTWVIFRAETWEQANKIYSGLFNFSNFVIPKTVHLNFIFKTATTTTYENVLFILPLAFILVFFCNNSQQIVSKIKIDTKIKAIVYAVCCSILLLLCLVKITTNHYSEFIYFNF